MAGLRHADGVPQVISLSFQSTSFEDKCVTKLELGDEENGAVLVLDRV